MRDYIVDQLERWGEWNRTGIFTGKYRCTLAYAFTGSHHQETAGYIPPNIEQINSAILKLNQRDSHSVNLIRARYLKAHPASRIAQDWHISRQHVYRLLERAHDQISNYLTM